MVENPGDPGRHIAVTVLFVAANPLSTSRLRLDEEIRQIHDKMRGENQDAVRFESAWAARPDDLLYALNRYRPQVLHFSGHGDSSGELIFVDNNGHPKPVAAAALVATLRSAGEDVRLVVLNSCHSIQLAESVARIVPCAIGMKTEIGDDAAIAFAAAFYRAASFAKPVSVCFDQALASLLLEGIPAHDAPALLCREEVEPSRLFLVDAPPAPRKEGGLKIVDIGLVGDAGYIIKEHDGILHITLRDEERPPR